MKGDLHPRLVVRRATTHDRATLLEILRQAFSRPDRPADFMRMLPYLFTDRRMNEHFLCEMDGAAVGAAGAYAYELRVADVQFRVAGIGQVACLPAYRGQGVMTAALAAVRRYMAEARFDFSWLGGDRTRYAHFGWTLGGQTLVFRISRRSLGGILPLAEARPINIEDDMGAIRTHLSALPDAFEIDEEELISRLAIRRIEGWSCRDGFILLSAGGKRVVAGGGEPDVLKRLLARQIEQLERAPTAEGALPVLEVEVSRSASSLMAACRDCYAGMTLNASGCLRVGSLASLLEKAGRMAGVIQPYGCGEIGLVDVDTGDSATVSWSEGQWHVAPGATQSAFRLTTLQLSELVFGWAPPDDLLPRLPIDSPVRKLLPLPVYLWPIVNV
jgi:predicted N-acetyltransferase YhbS